MARAAPLLRLLWWGSEWLCQECVLHHWNLCSPHHQGSNLSTPTNQAADDRNEKRVCGADAVMLAPLCATLLKSMLSAMLQMVCQGTSEVKASACSGSGRHSKAIKTVNLYTSRLAHYLPCYSTTATDMQHMHACHSFLTCLVYKYLSRLAAACRQESSVRQTHGLDTSFWALI